MAAKDPSSIRKPRIILTLVNGTFARDAEWVRNRSDDSFRATLKRELEDDFNVEFRDGFSWGAASRFGRYFLDNRMNVRLNGGRKLREYLLDLDKPADAQHYVIAHSHGGNVALYALKDKDTRNIVDGLVCMGTPFLFSELKKNLWGWTGFSVLVLTFVALDYQLWWLWLYTLLFWILIIRTVVSGNYKTNSAKLTCKYEELRLPVDEIKNEARPKVLTICTSRDEAFGLLKFTGRAGNAVRWIWSQVTRFGNAVFYVFIGIFLIRIINEELQLFASLDSIDMAGSYLDQWIMTPLLLSITVIVMAVVILRMSYAYDSASWITKLDTQTKLKPWPEMIPVQLPFDKSAKGLRHSNIPKRSIHEIAAWIRLQKKESEAEI